MKQADLEKFRQAVDLAQLGRKEEANRLLRELGRSDPTNIDVALWFTYTASDLFEARRILDKVIGPLQANPEIARAKNWLTEQERQRLGKRYRGDITNTFVPRVPGELKNVASVSASKGIGANLNMPAVPGLLISQPQPPNGKAPAQQPQPQPPEQPIAATRATTGPVGQVEAAKSGGKTKPAKVPASVAVKDTDTTGAGAGGGKVKGRFWWWQKLLLGVTVGIVLIGLLAAGSIILIPQVKDMVFDTGPLTQAEQNYVGDVGLLNDLATARIKEVGGCLLNPNPKGCEVDTGYNKAYTELGEVRDKFQALKSPSRRFEGAVNTLSNAYSSLGAISSLAFEAINQHQMVNNKTEMLTRLDRARSLLEQAKAELSALVKQFGPKR